MTTQIGPDLGDTITVEDQGANWIVTYPYIYDPENDGTFLPKQTATVSFPSAFNDLNPDDVEDVMLQLAVAVSRARGDHD